MNHRKARATPTQRELRIWRGYVETTEAVRSRLASRLQKESELSSGDYQVLLALSEAPMKTLRSSELATIIEWERSRLSHHLGRMEKRELIQRRRCTDDTHGVEVIMTERGISAFRLGTVPHLRAVRELFVDALSAEQLDQLDNITQDLRKHLQLDHKK